MISKRLGISNKVMFTLLSISLLLCMDIALGSTLDIYVAYKGNPVGQAAIYIDNNSTEAGKTLSDGTLKNINVNSGPHTVIAKWLDGNGQEHSGTKSFTTLPESYTQLSIDLI